MQITTHLTLSPIAKALILAIGFSSTNALAFEQTESKQAEQQSVSKSTEQKKKNSEITEDIEVIEVLGIKGSIQESLNNKRYAEEILDSISAEDIGQMPDENIAEALQRVSGISLTRADDGEGQSVQIRGDSSNNIEINGQTVVGSGENPRAVNLQDIPSELFSKIEVLKTSSADRIEGSIGGTVNLSTKKPLDIQKDRLTSVTAKAKYHELADKTTPDVTIFNASNWRNTSLGDFGLNLTLNAKEVYTRDEAFGAATWNGAPSRWTVYTGLSSARDSSHFSDTSRNPYDANLDPNQDGVSDENDIFYVPNLWKVYANEKESERIGANFTLQWQPSNEIDLWLGGSYTHREDELTNQSFSMQANTGTPQGNAWDPANTYLSFPLESGMHHFEKVNSTGQGDFYAMTAGRLGGVNTVMGASPAVGTDKAETYQFTLGGEFDLTDVLVMSSEFSTSESTSDKETSQLLMSHDYNGDNTIKNNDFAAVVDFDERNSDFAFIDYYNAPLDTNNFVEIDPSDPNFEKLNYRQLQRNATDVKNTSDALRVDFKYDLDSLITSLQFGYRYANRTAERVRYMAGHSGNPDGIYEDNRLVLPHIANVPVNDPDNQISVDLAQCHTQAKTSLDEFSGNIPSTWLATDCDSKFIEEYFNLPNIRAINPNTGDPYYQRNGQRYNNMDVEEETNAIYLRANFFTDFFNTGINLVGNIGVRYVTTDITGKGWIDAEDDTNYNFEQITVHEDYNHTLPSLNANWLLSDTTILRFAWSKNIARPSLNQVSPSFNLNYAENPDELGYTGTGNAGNPALKPREAENVDLSFEWYFKNDGLLSVAFYYKDISNLAELLPNQELVIGDETFLVNQWQNIGSTYVKGFELGWQQSFNFLPGLLKNTGINFNYTHPIESETLVDGQGDPLVKEGHSEDNINTTLYYDDRKFSMRLAYAYRSEYVRDYQATLGYGRVFDPYRIPQYVDAYGQFDFYANYKVSNKLRFNFSVTNLTDEHATWYLKHKQMTDRVSYTGRKANLSVQYKF